MPRTDYELVMYTRSSGCPFVSIARSVLRREDIPYREVNIDRDNDARRWLLDTVGFLSVPTLVIARAGEDRPISDPAPLPAGHSPRGIDRGPIITEPGSEALTAWLQKHGLLPVG